MPDPNPSAKQCLSRYDGTESSGRGRGHALDFRRWTSEKAGMKAGDIVEKLDGKKLQDYDALVAAIRASKPGDKMKLTVKRGESTKEIEVTLGGSFGRFIATPPLHLFLFWSISQCSRPAGIARSSVWRSLSFARRRRNLGEGQFSQHASHVL